MGTFTQPAEAKSVHQPASSLAEMPTPGPVNSSGTNHSSMIGKSIRIKGEIVAPILFTSMGASKAQSPRRPTG